ncbi:phosphatidate cytidylyltransferase [Hymenobacter fastidiosus]|uniref:Phosphatidate cytidylyltransferase n=1 Tax=Hymenobacter fastidiosus TaxID=486264 RepID=A0ABP7RXL2_9BACT
MPVPSTPAPVPAQPTEGKKPLSNLAQRVIFGVIGAAALLGSVWYGPWTFALFFAAVQAKMLLEFYRMMRAGGYQPAKWIGLTVSLMLFASFSFMAFYKAPPKDFDTQDTMLFSVGGAVLLLLVVLPIALVLREMVLWPKYKSPFGNIGATLTGLLYVSIPMSLLCVISCTSYSEVTGKVMPGLVFYDYRRIFALLFLVWCSDIGAYAAGKTFGRHKLAPSISPGKTWEGAIGGFLLTLVMGWALGYLLPELSLTYRLVAAGVVAVFGPLGDLAESMLKRSVGVKDSGSIMPGHGGLLDRFDAFLFILPVLALLQVLLG